MLGGLLGRRLRIRERPSWRPDDSGATLSVTPSLIPGIPRLAPADSSVFLRTRHLVARTISLGIGQIAADKAAEQPSLETLSSRD